MLSTAGVVALPAALALLEPPIVRAHTLALPGMALLISGAMYFIGLALTASAGRPLDGERQGQEGVLFSSDGNLFVHTEDGAWTLPMRSLRGGHYQAAAGILVLSAEDDMRVAVTVRDERDARRILSALGLDRGASTIEVTRGTRAARVVEAGAAGVAGLFVSLLCMLATVVLLDTVSPLPGGLLSLFALLMSALAPILLTIRYVSRFGDPLRVVLGTDGALVGTGNGAVFLGYDDIDSLQCCESGVIVRRIDGSDHYVRTAEPVALSSALADRLDARPTPSGRIPGVERASLSFDAWKDRLRGLASTPDRYRIGQVDGERFAELVEDPRASVEQRIGAAFVIGARRDPDLIARVKAAADDSAHPGLRGALLAAAQGEIEEAAVEEAQGVLGAPIPCC